MIKQIPSKEIKNYIKNNPKCVLLDVRTEEEWYMFSIRTKKKIND